MNMFLSGAIKQLPEVLPNPSLVARAAAGPFLAESADKTYLKTQSFGKAYAAPAAGLVLGTLSGSIIGRMAARAMSGAHPVPGYDYPQAQEFIGSTVGGTLGGMLGRYLGANGYERLTPVTIGAALGAGAGGLTGYLTGRPDNKRNSVMFGAGAGVLAGGLGGYLLDKYLNSDT